MLTAAFPVLVTVTVFVVMLPWLTVPKLMLDGDTVTNGPVAVTFFVSGVAATKFALPAWFAITVHVPVLLVMV